MFYLEGPFYILFLMADLVSVKSNSLALKCNISWFMDLQFDQGSYIDKDTGLVPVMHARGTSGSAKRICCIGK